MAVYSHVRSQLPALFGAALLTACGGGGDSTSTPQGSQAPVQLLLESEASNELLALESVLQGFRLERLDGSLTPELLPGNQEVELFGLDGRAALLSSRPVAAGFYRAVLLDLAPATSTAKDLDGAQVGVTGGGTWRVELDPPRALGGSDGGRVALSLALDDSLNGAPEEGLVDFAPTGSAISTSADDDLPLDDLFGLVIDEDPAGERFLIEAYLSLEALTPVGEVEVRLAEDALFIGPDDQPLAGAAALFEALVPGQSVVQVVGRVGTVPIVIAERVEIETQLGPDGTVRIEGVVVGIEEEDGRGPGDPAPRTFELLVAEIEQGALLAESVLSSLGDPATITVEVGPNTLFLVDDDCDADDHDDHDEDEDDDGDDDGDDDHGDDDYGDDDYGDDDHDDDLLDELELGQRVDVTFAEFLSEPFLAIEIEAVTSGGSFHGEIADTSELPDRFVLRLSDDDWGTQGSGTTEVVVELDGSEPIDLKLPGDPALVPEALLTGLRVRVRGQLGAQGGVDRLLADDVLVWPGRLKQAEVTDTDFEDGTLATAGGQLKASFGDSVQPGPLTVLVEPGAFTPGVGDLEDLFEELFEPGAKVDVRGIGTGSPGEVRAFWVKAK